MPNKLHVSEQLKHSTVRIECDFSDGETVTGTGFFYEFKSENKQVGTIVTNNHLVKGAVKGRFVLTLKNQDGLPILGIYKRIEIENFSGHWIPHPDSRIDLCIMKIDDIFKSIEQILGCRLYYILLDESIMPTEEQLDELTPIEEIIMIGYPDGIWDISNNLPIVRRGTTATHPAIKYNGNHEFLIDAACFPGSSGSPVFLYNQGFYYKKPGVIKIGIRLLLLGIQYSVRIQKLIEVTEYTSNANATQQGNKVQKVPINLGSVISSLKLNDFIPLI